MLSWLRAFCTFGLAIIFFPWVVFVTDRTPRTEWPTRRRQVLRGDLFLGVGAQRLVPPDFAGRGGIDAWLIQGLESLGSCSFLRNHTNVWLNVSAGMCGCPSWPMWRR